MNYKQAQIEVGIKTIRDLRKNMNSGISFNSIIEKNKPLNRNYWGLALVKLGVLKKLDNPYSTHFPTTYWNQKETDYELCIKVLDKTRLEASGYHRWQVAKNHEMQEYYTIGEAAEILNTSKRSIQRKCKSLDVIKDDGAYVITEDIIDMLKEYKTEDNNASPSKSKWLKIFGLKIYEYSI